MHRITSQSDAESRKAGNTAAGTWIFYAIGSINLCVMAGIYIRTTLWILVRYGQIRNQARQLRLVSPDGIAA